MNLKNQSLERRLKENLAAARWERARGMVSSAFLLGAITQGEYAKLHNDIDAREAEAYARDQAADAECWEAA